jgi:predicted HTH transcriptional regulator
MNNKFSKIPENLQDYLHHGREETYLEYKGDVSWDDRKIKLQIVQTILALSNNREGGLIVIGVEDNGELIGLSENNFNSFSHDKLNQFLQGKTNQPVECTLSKYEEEDPRSSEIKKFVFIQVTESREFPVIYIGPTEFINKEAGNFLDNIGLRHGALYIRNKYNIGNKEISTTEEWQELIERTYRKYEKETLRRYNIIDKTDINPFDKELTI